MRLDWMLTVPRGMEICPGQKLEGEEKALGLISKN